MNTGSDFETLKQRLKFLRGEHRDLDGHLQDLYKQGERDQLKLARMKKEKLRLKEQIVHLENWLVPEIIA